MSNNAGTLLREFLNENEISNNSTITTIDIDAGYGLYKADGTSIPTPKSEVTVSKIFNNDIIYIVNGINLSKEKFDELQIKESDYSMQ